jgi:cystathionine beta-lyase
MKDPTLVTHAGKGVDPGIETVNPPVYRASTVLYPNAAALSDHGRSYVYGRRGTPTTRALEAAICTLEGGARTVLLPSGLAAISCALLSVLSAGDDVLITDSCYAPARHFADTVLARLGITTRYYDPAIGAGIRMLITPKTRAVFCESPGSLTFEMQDIPAIAGEAHAKGALVIADNTWASPLCCKPLSLGADLVIESATKYIAGHSDVMLGTVTANEASAKALTDTHGAMGGCASPDDVYLTLRGLRTLSVRMKQHQENALILAKWLQARPEVERVLYPALPDSAGYRLWERDFTGASGTFSVVLKAGSVAARNAFVDGMKLFGIGYSFGGYESLILPSDPVPVRSATRWQGGPVVRLHVGLEDPSDLIADLEAGFARLAKASRS